MVDELDIGWLVGILVTTVHLEGVDSVLVNALRKDCELLHAAIRLGTLRVGDQGWCHSSSTSTSRHPLRVHMNMPLRIIEASVLRTNNWPAEIYIPAPRPFSPFSNSSKSLKFLGTLAPMIAV